MILLSCLIGAFLGIIAGLTPGLHTNTISALIALSPFFGKEIMTLVLSMSIVQSFVEFIPSTFLGVPSTTTFEGVLPAHKMLLEGRGLEAITLTVFGGIIGTIISVISIPLFFLIIEQNKKEIILLTPIILILALIIMIQQETTEKKKIVSLIIILIAGTQGILFKNQIFALITGYFGIAGTLYALKEKNIYKKQENEIKIEKKTNESILGLIGGAIVAVMPGIGSNTAAGIIKTFKLKIDEKGYLTMLGSINTVNFFFGFITLFALNKTRNGAMIAIQDKTMLTEETMLLGVIIMLISAGIGGISTIILSKKIIKYFNEKNTKKLNKISLGIMILVVFLQGGIIGILASIFSTALGLLVITNKVKRSLCMSSLILPTLFFYLFILI